MPDPGMVRARIALIWVTLVRRFEDWRTPPAVWDDKSLTGEGEGRCSTESRSTTPD